MWSSEILKRKTIYHTLAHLKWDIIWFDYYHFDQTSVQLRCWLSQIFIYSFPLTQDT